MDPVTNEPESLEQTFAREEAEIAELLKGQTTEEVIDVGRDAEHVPEPVETTEEIIAAADEPVEKEPVVEVEPKVEAKPEPEPKVEAKPPEQRKERVPVWKALRDQKRQNEALQQENERLRKAAEERFKDPADPYYPNPDEIVDPIEQLQKNQKNLDTRLAQQAEEIRQQKVNDAIKTDEERFISQHPDYRDALEHVVKRARDRFTDTGELEDQMEVVLKNHQPVIDQIIQNQKIANPSDDDVYRIAEDIAFFTLFERERNQFVSRQMAKGKSVAAAAYQLAQSEGYAPKARTAAVVEVDPVEVTTKPAETAQERVQRRAKVELATQSLSAMNNGGPPKSSMVKSKTEFMQLTPAAQDKLIAALEDSDPDWLQGLPD